MQADFMDKSTLEDLAREVSRIKSVVTEAVEDGIELALKTAQQGREVAEDAIHDARRVLRRNPEAMALAFIAGLALGGFAIWLGKRR